MRALLCILLFAITSATRGATEFGIHLDGAHAIPPNNSDLKVDGLFSYNGSHLHGDVIVDDPFSSQVTSLDLFSSPSPFVPGLQIGSFHERAHVDGSPPDPSYSLFTIDLDLTATQINDLFSSKLWLNLGTFAFPDGEVRGQLVVPEPSSYALFAIGVLLTVAIRRKRSAFPRLNA